MKFKCSLLFMAMVIISLLAITSVSAADNANYAISDASDVDITGNDISQDIDALADESNGEVIAAGADDDAIKSNGTSFDFSSLTNRSGNGSSFDFSSLTNRSGSNRSNSSFDIASIISMLGGSGGNKDTINSTDMTKYYSQTTNFRVTVLSGNQTLSKGTVVFTLGNRDYTGHIGSDGVAVLSVKNLKPGTYNVFAEYGQTIVKNTITVKKAITTKNVSKKYRKAGKFNVKVLNVKGKAQAKQLVKIVFKGKTYNLRTNSKGIASFKIPKNLKVGKHTVKTVCKGLTFYNKIIVKK